jgi:hypothetical protein
MVSPHSLVAEPPRIDLGAAGPVVLAQVAGLDGVDTFGALNGHAERQHGLCLVVVLVFSGGDVRGDLDRRTAR